MGDTRLKTYYYYRNGLLHIKHLVDECVELSLEEQKKLTERLTENPSNKQEILEDEWFFQTACLKKKLHRNGIEKARENFHRMSDRYTKGGKND